MSFEIQLLLAEVADREELRAAMQRELEWWLDRAFMLGHFNLLGIPWREYVE